GSSQPQSGGKIVRPRRTAVFRTPYDRPTPRDPSQQNPSWISKLVYKPARIIASGAGKIISSVVFSESSSSSSEDEDSSSGMHPLDLVNAQESTFHKLSSKRVIEQLLMQETFAREEGDRLIDIIKERVSVPTSNEGMHNGLTNDVNVGEMSSKAVMEAKRWLEEKKSASLKQLKMVLDRLWTWPSHTCELVCHGDLRLQTIQFRVLVTITSRDTTSL
ncbi:unnamed protein product, partial [Brassica rapa]